MRWKSLQMPKGVELDEHTATREYGKFVVEPLERGYGVTLGNSLRRVLLSSLQGAAITAIRIEGVPHEFSVIPGVLEDVTQIILNLKEVRIKYHADDPVNVTLHKKGKGTIKACDIVGVESFDILNPNHLIATLNDDADLRMELEIGTGRGYVTVDQHKKPNQPLGTIPIDALYTPVTKVRYNVQETRVGQRTDYEKLVMEIWTDGSLTPREALSYSAKILKDYFQMFVCYEAEFEEVQEEEINEEIVKIRNLLNMSVDELELSVRSSNCLKAANIKTIRELVQKTEQEMLKYRNFGRKSLSELQVLLEGLGLSFGMDLTRYDEQQPPCVSGENNDETSKKR